MHVRVRVRVRVRVVCQNRPLGSEYTRGAHSYRCILEPLVRVCVYVRACVRVCMRV